MEEDIQKTSSLVQATPTAERINERMEKAIAIARDAIDHEEAHNPDTLRALDIVHTFLKRRGRVCYGGTAMNAILPEAKRFYDPDVDLPDYDFFSPDVEADTVELVEDLKRAGFKDVYSRIGMHEGTKKILVNFRPIADMSSLDPAIYAVFNRRAMVRDGVRYADPDILRMMMYLELSRPKGQVGRWDKVFERLQLINSVFPLGVGGPGRATRRRGGRGGATVPLGVRRTILDYCIEQGRVILSGPLESIYEQAIRGHIRPFEVSGRGGPVLALTPQLQQDADALKAMLAGAADTAAPVTLFLHKAHGELVPARIEIRRRGMPVAMLMENVACHAYNSVNCKDGRQLLVASPETFITIMLALDIFAAPNAKLYEGPILPRVKRMAALAARNYAAPRSAFPAFALTCKGYQKGYPTLLRERVERAAAAKGAAKATMRPATTARSLTRRKKRAAK